MKDIKLEDLSVDNQDLVIDFIESNFFKEEIITTVIGEFIVTYNTEEMKLKIEEFNSIEKEDYTGYNYRLKTLSVCFKQIKFIEKNIPEFIDTEFYEELKWKHRDLKRIYREGYLRQYEKTIKKRWNRRVEKRLFIKILNGCLIKNKGEI